MNRIILIGNGFDLAHGLETSYNDFLNDFWKRAIEKIKKTPRIQPLEIDEFDIKNRFELPYDITTYNELIKFIHENNNEIKYKNRFLEKITYKKHFQNWVDIENEYYNILKKSLPDILLASHSIEISKLNSYFEDIKKHLITYLKQIQQKFENRISNNDNLIYPIGTKIFSSFRIMDFTENLKDVLAKVEYEFLNQAKLETRNPIKLIDTDKKIRKVLKIFRSIDFTEKDIRNLLQSANADEYFDLTPKNILFLNFNYTSTESLYKSYYYDRFLKNNKTNVSTNHIHGSIEENEKNPIIFGFGDELDEDYKKIENLNDNRFLENVKSINYLDSYNYKNLLEYIESDYFQIFIMGHSCGISDRTLLNTLFEHENCVSIKPFYHKRKNNTDNYKQYPKKCVKLISLYPSFDIK